MGYTLSALYAELYDAFLAFERPRVSRQGYTSIAGRVRRVLAWFDSEELDPCNIAITDAVRYEAYLAECMTKDGSPISAGTAHNYIQAARRLWSYLVQTGRATVNPFLELGYPRRAEHLSRNGLTEAQMGRLLAALASFDELAQYRLGLRRYRVHVIAEFLYATGLRIAEAAALTESNLDLEARLVYVVAGKGGKARTAFLTSYAARVIELYLDRGRSAVLGLYPRKNGETLFGSDKGGLAALVNRELKAVCTELGLPVITTHGFRHSLGTHLLRAGCDMRHIQALLGHEALGTTQVYTKVDKDDLKKSLDEFHPRKWQARGVHHDA
jgi:integrase/recombinase XerD